MHRHRALAAVRAIERMNLAVRANSHEAQAQASEPPGTGPLHLPGQAHSQAPSGDLEAPLLDASSPSGPPDERPDHAASHRSQQHAGSKGSGWSDWVAPRQDAAALWGMLKSSWLNALLVLVPLGIASGTRSWPPAATFALNLFALVPLALLLGEVTEDVALRTGDVIGGLVNATFGNVVEMILAASALSKGLLVVVSTSLLGSILSNLLLVLGCCFLFGGLRHKQQRFSMAANKVSSSLLFLSCIGIIIPTAIDTLPRQTPLSSSAVLTISHISAIVLLGVYLLYLLFELYTHNFLFASSSQSDEEQRPALSASGSILMLAAITVAVAVASEYLTGSIEEVSKATGLSQAFIGIVILPIAGNACEHAAAVMVAMKDKMDLAIGISLGSSIQIAIFAIPFITLLGWAIGQPFSLSFDPFVTLALTVAVIHANFINDEATSHWLMGVQLLATYLLIGVTFLFR